MLQNEFKLWPIQIFRFQMNQITSVRLKASLSSIFCTLSLSTYQVLLSLLALWLGAATPVSFTRSFARLRIIFRADRIRISTSSFNLISAWQFFRGKMQFRGNPTSSLSLSTCQKRSVLQKISTYLFMGLVTIVKMYQFVVPFAKIKINSLIIPFLEKINNVMTSHPSPTMSYT